jgi:hypothetical protein
MAIAQLVQKLKIAKGIAAALPGNDFVTRLWGVEPERRKIGLFATTCCFSFIIFYLCLFVSPAQNLEVREDGKSERTLKYAASNNTST